MTPDFSRWAVYAHKDDTGFGRMAADVRAVLGVGRQIVVPSERLADRDLDPRCEALLAKEDSEDRVREVLTGLEGILFFERASWHQAILRIAREMGVKTVCIPMWEWFYGKDANWKYCDLFACPSEFTASIVRSYGFQNVIHLPWAFHVGNFPARRITGKAARFIHNAGLVDAQDRKGTRETILAFRQSKRSDIRLTVRMQKEAELPKLDDRIELHVGNLDRPEDLYGNAEVAIQPSKMEGIGFMVLEPVASGLPTITLDYPPMNSYVQQPELLVRKRWFKRRAFPTAWVRHAHLRLPDLRDLTRKIEWCADHSLDEISRYNREWAERTFDVSRLREQWSEALGAILRSGSAIQKVA